MRSGNHALKARYPMSASDRSTDICRTSRHVRKSAIGRHREMWSQRDCCSEVGASGIALLEVKVIGNLVEARPSMATFSSFNRRSMNWRSRSERLVLSNLRYRLMLLPCARRLATFRSIIGRQRYDDYTVIWRGLPIGRIMRASGGPMRFVATYSGR